MLDKLHADTRVERGKEVVETYGNLIWKNKLFLQLHIRKVQ
jgi:hypothetical protein